VGTERAVGEQVTSGPDRAEFPGRGGTAQLPPVPVHLGHSPPAQREKRGEVVLARDVPATALVHRRDAEGRGMPQGAPLGGGALRRGHRLQRHPPYRVVRREPQPARRVPARLVRHHRGQQRRRHDRRVRVDAGQVHRAALGGAADHLGAGWLAHRPRRLVPAVPDHHPLGRVLGGVLGEPFDQLAG
jgi:hypothetical protein